MSVQAGTVIGPYEIVAPLGAGGMGEVYRARDPKLERDVALKILPPDLAANSEHLRRFEQEARAASALNHPNIVTIYDVGRVGSIAWIAMELIEGSDLRHILAGGALPMKQALRVATKIADGLAAAHDRGIVHRDLKPENVMITGEGFVKVLDFGLAKLIRPPSVTDPTVPHTTPGAIFGTVAYMSPEQASGKSPDFRGDQFSLGTILFEMLAGKRPFDRPTSAETMTAIIREEPPALSELVEGTPPELLRLLDRCLAKEAHARYASTHDLARDLRDVRDALTSAAPGSGRRSVTPRRRSRLTVANATLAAGAFIVIIGGALMVQRREPAPPPRQQTLAVLPFRDLTATTGGQAFADGLAQTIAERLASARLRVVRTDREIASVDPESAARRSGATLLLQASVTRSAESLRVMYTLRDANSGAQMRSDTVAAPANNVFALVERISDSIGTALQLPAPRGEAQAIPLMSADDQRVYFEAVGLLRRFRDEAAIDDAIQRLERLLLNARDSASVNALLARALLRKYDLTADTTLVKQATIYGERAADLEPSLPDVHTTLGDLHRISGRLYEAEREYRKTLALRSDDADAHLGLAETFEAMGRGAEAKALYEKTIVLAPGWPRAYGTFARFHFVRGQHQEAISLFRKVVELIPEAPRAHSNLGAAYQAAGRHDEALRAYQRSIALGPTASGYSNLGVCYYALGRFREAAAAFENAVRLAPADCVIWANLGDAYRWIPGETAKAQSAFDHAVRAARGAIDVNPKDPLIRAIAASSLAKQGKSDPAAAEIKEALKIDPTSADVLYQAAVVALLAGDREAAIGWLERAVRAGYRPHDAARDPELAPLRNHAKFPTIFATARAAA